MQSELPVIIAIIAVLVGIPFALLLLKILRGDFWPVHIYNEYREGKRDASVSDDE